MSKEVEKLVDAFENAVIAMQDVACVEIKANNPQWDDYLVKRRRASEAYRTTKANLLEAMCV